jgi:hypothetical protein
VQPTLEEEIKKAQHKDKDLMKIREQTGKIKPHTSKWMTKEPCGIRIGFVCPR